jgi:hypothetical protein
MSSSYADFANKPRSQKIILAWLYSKQKAKIFTLHSGSIYKRTTLNFVDAVSVDGASLVSESVIPTSSGKFYYDIESSILYVWLSDSSDPKTKDIYIKYKHFYSDYPCDLPHDLDTGSNVHYDERISDIGELKLELDYEQTGVAIESDSTIQLQNTDGHFDEIFDTQIWEGQIGTFFSWSYSIPISEAKIIYRGLVYQKSFSSKDVKFNLRDQINQLNQKIPISRFSALDGEVDQSAIGMPKRLIFGKFDRLKTTGIDKTLNGFALTGTISGNANKNLLTGSVSGNIGLTAINGVGTSFLTQISAGQKIRIIAGINEYTYTVLNVPSNVLLNTTSVLTASFSNANARNLDVLNNELIGIGTDFKNELSPNDKVKVTVNDTEYEYTIDTINSPTLAILSDEIESSFTGTTIINEPEIPYRGKNRQWHIAGHKLREYQTTITVITNETNIEVATISDIEEGDYISILNQIRLVKGVSGNKIKINQSLPTGTVVSDTLTKIPVYKSYQENTPFVFNRDYTISNTLTDCILTFNNLAEFNTAKVNSLSIQFQFTNGSASVSSLSSDVDLTTVFKTRDWIKTKDITDVTWYEVLTTSPTAITLRTNFTGTTQAITAYKKSPNYISDDSNILVDCNGLESGGEWVRYPAQAVKYLLEFSGLTPIYSASFIDAVESQKSLLSLPFPESIETEIQDLKSMVTTINQSVFGSLYLNNNFEFSYSILNASREEISTEVKDDDIKSFSVATKNNIINSIRLNYRPYFDYSDIQDEFSVISLTSDFVDRTSEVKKELEVTSYLYKYEDALEMAERWLFFRSLNQSVVTVDAKLNFTLNSLNDRVYLNLDRLFKRFGSQDRRKIGIINSISKDGTNTKVSFNDLGGVYSRIMSIAPDLQNDFTTSELEDIAKYGFILDNELETPDNSEETLGCNLIG